MGEIDSLRTWVALANTLNGGYCHLSLARGKKGVRYVCKPTACMFVPHEVDKCVHFVQFCLHSVIGDVCSELMGSKSFIRTALSGPFYTSKLFARTWVWGVVKGQSKLYSLSSGHSGNPYHTFADCRDQCTADLRCTGFAYRGSDSAYHEFSVNISAHTLKHTITSAYTAEEK